jgi:hypothetical protein
VHVGSGTYTAVARLTHAAAAIKSKVDTLCANINARVSPVILNGKVIGTCLRLNHGYMLTWCVHSLPAAAVLGPACPMHKLAWLPCMQPARGAGRHKPAGGPHRLRRRPEACGMLACR